MEQVPREICEGFERRLEGARIPELQRPGYRKWLRFYIDFCHKYGHSPTSASSLGPFLSKLASKSQSVENRNQAALAVRLQLAAARGPGSTALRPAGEVMPGDGATQSARARVAPPAVNEQRREPGNASALEASFTQSRTAGEPRTTGWVASSPPHPPGTGSAAGRHGVSGVSASAPGRGSSWEREYRDLEGAIRLRNYSGKTLEAYRLWVAKFQGFVRSRPTGELGTEEVRGFLTDLAVRQGVAASTQNQAT